MAGTEIAGGGARGRLYLTLHCHHQSDSCIKMGSGESHFNVSLFGRGGGNGTGGGNGWGGGGGWHKDSDH